MTNPDGSLTFVEANPDCLPGKAFDRRIAVKRKVVDGTPVGWLAAPPYSTDLNTARALVKGLHAETREMTGYRIHDECPWEAVVGEEDIHRQFCAEGFTEAHALAVAWWDYVVWIWGRER